MSPEPFTSGNLPAYHSAKLIVKMARDSSEPLRAMANSFAGGAVAAFATTESVGLKTLERFVRAGLIKRTIPLSQRFQRAAAAGLGPIHALGMLADASESTSQPDSNARVNLLELESDDAVNQLRDALATDPMVEYVSRIPVRYLCLPRASAQPKARKKTETSKRKASGRKAAMFEAAVPAAAAPDSSAMWNLPKIRWADARNLPGFKDASTIKIAVLDTGVDTEHPDAGAIANYVFDHPLVPDASSAKDYIGHGTHVSGTIAARINNQIGINGITPCQLYVWKIFTDKPIYDSFNDRYIYVVDTAMYHRALADCLDEGIDAINLSIGGPGSPDQNELTLFQQLLAAGTSIVAAMGNERAQGSPISYPAAIDGVIAVGATNINDQVTSFSNRGPHIALCAPGDTIWSTLPTYAGQTGFRARHLATGEVESGSPVERDTDYAAWNGTSMATPHVTAAVGLLLAKEKRTPAEVRQKLMQTADRVPGMGTQTFHQDYGAGRLNLERLLS